MKYISNKENTNTLSIKNSSKLDPNWITGFTYAEGSFVISIYKNKISSKTEWRVQASFQIGLHNKDLDFLLSIKSFFNNIGNIYTKKNNSAIYTVCSVNFLIDFIIPHFEKYPLITQKYSDFILFKDIVKLIKKKWTFK